MEIGTYAVHLVHEANPGNTVAIRLPPDRLRLGLNASHCIEDNNAPIEHPKTSFHLRGKVNMPRGVDNVDAMVHPLAGGSGSGNCYSPLSLLRHPVHHCSAIVHIAQLIGAAGIVKYPLSKCRFARIDMGNDTDIPDTLQIKCP